MNCGEIKETIRMMVPSANMQRVSDSQLLMMINKGVREINATIGVLIGDPLHFDAKAEVFSYDIRKLAPTFVRIGAGGLWYNFGTEDSPYYRQLWGVTPEYLNKFFPNWVNISSGCVSHYYTLPGRIVVYAPPASDLTNAFKLPDPIVGATDMTANTDYPFSGSESAYAELEVLDDAIIDYVRYILMHAVGSDQKGIVTRQEYMATLASKRRIFRTRPDIKANPQFRMRARRA